MKNLKSKNSVHFPSYVQSGTCSHFLVTEFLIQTDIISLFREMYKGGCHSTKTIMGGGSGHRRASFPAVLVHAVRWLKSGFWNHMRTDVIPLVLFYKRLTSVHVYPSDVTDLCWSLSLKSLTRSLSFNPPTITKVRKRCLKQKRTNKKILRGKWKSKKGKIHRNKNKSKTGIYEWTKGCVPYEFSLWFRSHEKGITRPSPFLDITQVKSSNIHGMDRMLNWQCCPHLCRLGSVMAAFTSLLLNPKDPLWEIPEGETASLFSIESGEGAVYHRASGRIRGVPGSGTRAGEWVLSLGLTDGPWGRRWPLRAIKRSGLGGWCYHRRTAPNDQT